MPDLWQLAAFVAAVLWGVGQLLRGAGAYTWQSAKAAHLNEPDAPPPLVTVEGPVHCDLCGNDFRGRWVRGSATVECPRCHNDTPTA